MNIAVKHLSYLEYFKDKDFPLEHEESKPSWETVESAIRQMDNVLFPIVALSCFDLSNQPEGFEDENSLNIIGGNGKYAITHRYGEWQYEKKNGETQEVRLWESDQGYFCKEKNILVDIEEVLKFVKKYFETGDYSQLSALI